MLIFKLMGLFNRSEKSGEPVGTRFVDAEPLDPTEFNFDPTHEEELANLIPEHLREPDEETIRNNPVLAIKMLGGGLSVSQVATLENGSLAVFKPVGGEPNLRRDAPPGSHFRNERAAYLISQLLDFDLVPATVIRKLEDQVGSLQDFLDGAKTAAEVSPGQLRESQYEEERAMMAIFDFIIWNTDRHKGNFMVDEDRIYAIDNGLSFANEAERWHFHILHTSVPESVVNKLKAFKNMPNGIETLQRLLRPLLRRDQVEACINRLLSVIDIVVPNGKVPDDMGLDYSRGIVRLSA